MWTVVLAGGRGTRLSPITHNEYQKVMVPVAGKPFIHHKLDNLVALGHQDIIVVVEHLGADVAKYIKNRQCWGNEEIIVRYDHEDWALPERYWLTYGDTLLDYPRAKIEDSSADTVFVVTPPGLDYGAQIRLRDGFGSIALWRVKTPYYHINTPEDLARTEQALIGGSPF